MKRTIVFFVLLLYLFSFQSTTFAAGSISSGEPSVYDSIQKGETKTSPASTTSTKAVDSQSTSLFPLFLKFIFSFILVIGLLFLLLRYLSKRGNGMQANGPVLPIGSHLLGNNRSMQILLIGQTIYIVGVGEDVTLIRTISQGEEYQHLLEVYENQAADGQTPKWFPKDTKKIWNTVFRKHLQNLQQESGEE
ncbi:flagellar biosynthetic protein FliO [Neobacillus drentensis]|uniref:flagellar biosynthetic protein FliO n=1 Tax=Neobacillus drentensis TaxID=220684 RepID=UPI002FFF216D